MNQVSLEKIIGNLQNKISQLVLELAVAQASLSDSQDALKKTQDKVIQLENGNLQEEASGKKYANINQ